MNTIIRLHNSFGEINYVDDIHQYILNKKKLISTTTVISSYIDKFDTEFWSYYKAVETNSRLQHLYIPFTRESSLEELKSFYAQIKNKSITVDDYVDSWDDLRLWGSANGSEVHDYAECMWYNKFMYKVDKDKSPLVYKMIKRAWSFISNNRNYVIVRPELIVGNYDLGIAGMVDALVYDTDTKEYVLVDWKTDKKFDKYNKFQYFKSPISDLQCCRFNKYSLQLSIYRYIIETYTDIKISKSVVVWLGNRNFKKPYEVIELPYLKSHVEKIIKDKKWQQ